MKIIKKETRESFELYNPITKKYVMNEKVYEKPFGAFFGVFEHPVAANRIAALFMPLSPQYADVVARKITHYGKYSYLAFQSGKNLDKGIWPVETSPLVYEWGHSK